MNAIWMILVEGLVIAGVGSILHFSYDWTRHNKYIGLVSAVNESTWEHLKIALFPMFLAMFVDGMFWGSEPNYFIGKLLSMATVLVLIPVLFYGYKATLRRDILALGIAIFLVVIFTGQAVFYGVTQVQTLGFLANFLAIVGLFLLFGILMVMTLLPIRNFIFKDPLTSRYGFRGHETEKEKRGRKGK